MPNRYAWIALGLGAYLAFALATFPAAAAYRWFAPPELRLAGIEGTLWSGRAALASAGDLPLSDLRWSLEALPLFSGRITGRAQARLADGFVDANLSASVTGTVILRDVQLATSLASLAPAVPIGDVRGRITLRLERIELRDGWPVAVVGNAAIGDLAAPTFVPGGQGGLVALGDYELTFEPTDDATILARFRDVRGPLEVAGTLTLDAERRYRIDAAAAPRPDAPSEVVQALELMAGPPRPEGKRPFDLTGSL